MGNLTDVLDVANLVSGFNRLAADPPRWVRLVAVPVFALLVLGLASKRGWLVGVIAAIVYGAIALPVAVTPGGLVAWSRRHPVVDGSMMGPLLFLALSYLTSWPIWTCLLVGLVGVLLGAILGRRRGRLRLERS